jgi:hypothetical protein
MTDFQEEWKFYKEITRSNQYFKKGDILTVSDWGRVKCNSEFYKCPINRGYYRLCREYLHRIVAEKFISGWKKDYEIDHKDCNPLNNRVDNLLICKDHKQNMNNPLTIKHNRETNTKPVLQYTLDNKFIAEYISIREASRQTKINKSNIVYCCKHRCKSAGDYIWKYKEE